MEITIGFEFGSLHRGVNRVHLQLLGVTRGMQRKSTRDGKCAERLDRRGERCGLEIRRRRVRESLHVAPFGATGGGGEYLVLHPSREEHE
jgi:hypothetical protein